MVFNIPLRGQAGGADVVRLRRHYVSAAVIKESARCSTTDSIKVTLITKHCRAQDFSVIHKSSLDLELPSSKKR